MEPIIQFPIAGEDIVAGVGATERAVCRQLSFNLPRYVLPTSPAGGEASANSTEEIRNSKFIACSYGKYKLYTGILWSPCLSQVLGGCFGLPLQPTPAQAPHRESGYRFTGNTPVAGSPQATSKAKPEHWQDKGASRTSWRPQARPQDANGGRIQLCMQI